jgi:nucleotide sugar dehydrogenase
LIEEKKLIENISKKTDMRNINEVKKSLAEGFLKICVIGIGRIGLPTALSFANSGLKTIGVDINTDLVNQINSRNFPLKDEPGYAEIFDKVIRNETFSATTRIEEGVPSSDVIILSLPTPMDENNIPNYSALTSVGSELNKLLEPSSLVIVESTVEPGFIENEFIQILETSTRLKAGKNFLIGVCPENANPGEILHDFTHLPRLVGGFDEKSLEIITMIYNHVFHVELVKMSDCKTANAVKLTTNVFRDINVAFVNELSILYEKLGIDMLEVLEAAKKKYNFQIHYPGAGVGGPCLPINSYQLLNSAKKSGAFLRIVKSSREINEHMPDHVIELVIDAFQEAKKPIHESTIAVLGISYKPDVKDIQLTPAESIIKKLQKLGAKIHIYDPYFKNTNIFGIKTEDNLESAVSNVDAITIVTAHNEFCGSSLLQLIKKMKSLIVIDSRGVIDTSLVKNNQIIFRGIGRGRI